MTQPPPGGYPPPEQTPTGGQPGYAAPPPAAPPAGGQGYPPPTAPPAGPPSGYAPGGPPPAAPAGPPAGYAPPPGSYPPPPTGGPGYPPPPGQQPGYPPPGGYPQQGQPAFAGAAGSSSMQFDISKITVSDWIIMGSGLVLLIFSFFGWLSVSYSGLLGGYGGGSVGAWHEYWWIATLLGLAVAVVVALRATMGQKLEQVKPLFLVAGAGLGFVITLIALIELFARGGSGDGFSVGPGFGIWVCLIVSLAQTYFVWLWAQKQPGWTLPKLPGPANF